MQELMQGDTWILPTTMLDDACSPVDLTTATDITATLKLYVTDPAVQTAVWTGHLGSGCTITSAVGGAFTVTVPAITTATLIPCEVYELQATVTFADGTITTAFIQQLKVLQEII